jgi:hypothetical protein
VVQEVQLVVEQLMALKQHHPKIKVPIPSLNVELQLQLEMDYLTEVAAHQEAHDLIQGHLLVLREWMPRKQQMISRLLQRRQRLPHELLLLVVDGGAQRLLELHERAIDLWGSLAYPIIYNE